MGDPATSTHLITNAIYDHRSSKYWLYANMCQVTTVAELPSERTVVRHNPGRATKPPNDIVYDPDTVEVLGAPR